MTLDGEAQQLYPHSWRILSLWESATRHRQDTPLQFIASPTFGYSSSYCRRMVSLCLSDACSSRASRLPRRATSLFSRVTSLRSSPRSARRDSIVVFWFLRPLQGRTQPARLLVRLCDRPAPGRLDAGFGKQVLQARDFGLQERHSSPCGGHPSSLRQPPSVCCGTGRAATSANPRGHGRPPPPSGALQRALRPRPLASTPAPPGHAPVRTGTASRAPRAPAPAPARRATKSRRSPRHGHRQAGNLVSRGVGPLREMLEAFDDRLKTNGYCLIRQ